MLLLLLLLSAPAVAGAQEPAAVVEARRLRDAGEPAAAAAALRPYAAAHPEDAGVQWLLAQLLHAAARTDAALAHYAAALRLTPDEPWLRLEVAELHAARGERSLAAELLRPVARAGATAPAAAAAAHAALGRLAYWRGDLAEALRRSRLALQLEPGHGGARDLESEVGSLLRPWTRLQLQALDDNQPYRQSSAVLEAGAYLAPLWTLSGGVAPGRRDAVSTAGSVDAWLATAGFLPGPQVEWALRAGGVWPDAAVSDGPVWTGAASLARRLAPETALRASAGRAPYRATAASLDTLLLVESAELRLDRAGAPGWAGEAVLRGERFPDGNTIATAYAWALAPLLPGVRAGYAFAWQDAAATTWVPRAGPSSAGAGTRSGHYAPYYTPEQMRSHSVLGELAAPLGGAALTLSGALGVHARERAPFLVSAFPVMAPPGSSAAALQVAFFTREFTPWRAAAVLRAPAGRTLLLEAQAEREHTAFYRSTRFGLGATYRFGGR